eukprot:4199811-Pyramimonas_sp.AAC.1
MAVITYRSDLRVGCVGVPGHGGEAAGSGGAGSGGAGGGPLERLGVIRPLAAHRAADRRPVRLGVGARVRLRHRDDGAPAQLQNMRLS